MSRILTGREGKGSQLGTALAKGQQVPRGRVAHAHSISEVCGWGESICPTILVEVTSPLSGLEVVQGVSVMPHTRTLKFLDPAVGLGKRNRPRRDRHGTW